MWYASAQFCVFKPCSSLTHSRWIVQVPRGVQTLQMQFRSLSEASTETIEIWGNRIDAQTSLHGHVRLDKMVHHRIFKKLTGKHTDNLVQDLVWPCGWKTLCSTMGSSLRRYQKEKSWQETADIASVFPIVFGYSPCRHKQTCKLLWKG